MYLVFDVGGTYIKHAMMNRDGSIVTKGKVKTPFTLGQVSVLFRRDWRHLSI